MLDSDRLKLFDPYLSSLPPEYAFQVMAGRYITVGTLTMFFWEILINIENDCNLLFEHSSHPVLPTVVYFISRLCCLGFTISATVLRVSLQSESICAMLSRVVPILYCAAIIFTSFLFFLRARAVFQSNPWIVAFFACLWLAVVGGCMAFVLDVLKEVRVNPALKTTSICFNAAISPFIAAVTIIPLINDTLIFIAITWRLSRNSYHPYTFGSSFRVLIFGDYLPVFSKVMLQNGQAYYLTIVSMNIISVIMLFYASYPSVFRTVFAVPNAALMNVMACRVFRNTILFKSRGEARTEVSSLQFL